MIMFWLKVLVIGAGLSGVGMAGAYVKGRMDCSEAAHVAQLQADKRQLLAELAEREARTLADQAQAERDRAERERLEEANRNLQNELEDPDRVCLDAPDVDRLRNLWP